MCSVVCRWLREAEELGEAPYNAAEDDVLEVQVRGRREGDEELRLVRVLLQIHTYTHTPVSISTVVHHMAHMYYPGIRHAMSRYPHVLFTS